MSPFFDMVHKITAGIFQEEAGGYVMEQLDIRSFLSKLDTPAGKDLIELMKKDGGTAFLKAAAAAKHGNYQEAKNILEPLLSGTNAEQLAQEITQHGR